MKLTTKIVSLWMAGTLIVVAAGTFFAIRHDGRLLQDDLRSEASEIGQTLAPLIQDAWRTSGEQRLSDFLLWECAYAELIFSRRMWPDFDAPDLEAAVRQFRSRERRFGAVPHVVLPSDSNAASQAWLD